MWAPGRPGRPGGRGGARRPGTARSWPAGSSVLPGNWRRRVPRNRGRRRGRPRPGRRGGPPGGCFLPGEAVGPRTLSGRRWDSGRVPAPRALRTPPARPDARPQHPGCTQGSGRGPPRTPVPARPGHPGERPPRTSAAPGAAAHRACGLPRPAPHSAGHAGLVGAATRRRGPNSARSAPGRWASAGAARGPPGPPPLGTHHGDARTCGSQQPPRARPAAVR